MNTQDSFFYKSNRLQQIRGFCYTLQLGSVSEAALKMGLQQSAVSMQIKALERDLGVTLFERNGPQLNPTEQAHLLFEMALPHVESINSLPDIFSRELVKLGMRSLKIAANQVSLAYILPSLIGACKNQFPDLGVTIHARNREEALDMIRQDEIQAYIGAIDTMTHEFEFHPVCTQEAILIARHDHPLITKKNFKMADMSGYPVVRGPSEFITVPFFEEILSAHKVKPYVLLEGGDWETFKSFVSHSNAFSIVSRLCYDPKRDKNIGVRGLRDFIPDLQYGIIVKKGKHLTPPLKKLIEAGKSF